MVCYISGYVSLLATCLTRAHQGLVNTWFCLMPDQFLFFMIFALGSVPLRFHPSLSSPSVEIVFSCQTCPGYSPIQCLRESLFSFLDFCLFVFPWRYFGKQQVSTSSPDVCFFTLCWEKKHLSGCSFLTWISHHVPYLN